MKDFLKSAVASPSLMGSLVALALSLGVSSCNSPNPGAEAIRVPTLATSFQYAREGEAMSLSLVAFMPDPQFKADRLDPDRYQTSELVFGCVGACPDGMAVDPSTGVVSWTPSYDDAGAHFVSFSVRSGIYASDRPMMFIVVDKDRVASPDGDMSTSATGKEAETLVFALSYSDPDGDVVGYDCVEGCLDGMTVDEASGKVTWTPTYFDAGDHVVTFRVTSRPADRPLVIRGDTAGLDRDEIRSRIELEAINRAVPLTTNVAVTLAIENTDRPPEPVAVQDIEAEEMDVIEFSALALDYDGDELLYACNETCPDGMVIDQRSGKIKWTPTYEQAGDYSVEIDVLSGGKAQTKIPIVIKVANKNRRPYFRGTVAPVSGREGSLVSFNLLGADPDKEDTPTYSCKSGCADGIVIGGVGGLVSWVPNYEQSGEYEIVFAISDGRETTSTTVKVSIAHVNRPPYFSEIPAEITLQAAVFSRVNLQGKDDDREDVGKLRYSCTQNCPEGLSMDEMSGQLKWQPTYVQSGDYAVTFGVSDGQVLTEAIIIIYVIKTDRAPRFAGPIQVQGEELQPLSFTISATDVDGDAVTYSCAYNCPAGLAVDEITGEVSWTPTAQQSGIHLVTLRASSAPPWDGTLFKNGDMVATIIIKNFNREPSIEAVAPTAFSVFEGGLESGEYLAESGHPLLIQLSASDPDGDPLTFLCSAGCPTGLSVNPSTGEVSWTPDYFQAKAADAPYTGIQFAVTDGEFMVKTNFISITVVNVNRPPVIATIGPQEVFENGHKNKLETSPTGFPLKFVVSASDSDRDVMSYRCYENCPVGLLINPGSGEISWTPTYYQAKNPPLDASYDGIVIAVSDGFAEVLSNPFSVKVKNVNRAPVISALPTEVEVFENGHASDDEGSPTNSPLSIPLVAIDPDGDPVTFACAAGCPKGLSIDPSNGVISWRPAYINSPENLAARPGNLPYTGMMFSATDALNSVTFSSLMAVRVKNVDRAPVFSVAVDAELRACEEPNVAGRSALRICQGQRTSMQLVANDPDGDVVSFRCDHILRKDAVSPSYCSTMSGLYVYVSETSGNPWLRLTSGGLITISPGYADAQAGNAAYNLFVVARSQPTLWPGVEKTKSQSIRMRPVNIDRDASMSPYYDRSVITYEHDEPVRLDFFGLPDPDTDYGDAGTIEFSCSPLSAEACPGNMIQNDGGLGTMTWTPSYAQAKKNNAAYSMKFRMTTTATDFYPDDKLEIDLDPTGPDYPPLVTESDTVSIYVRNADHVPVFVSGQPGFNELDVDVSEPSYPSGTVDTKSVSLLARDFDQTGNGVENEYGYSSLLLDTEEDVSYSIESCSNEDRDGNVVSFDCSTVASWIKITGSTFSVSPPDWNSAIPGQGTAAARRYITIRAQNQPKTSWGWTTREYSGGLYPWSTIRIAVSVQNVDRPPSVVSLYNSTQPSSLPETADWKFHTRATDADGDTVVYCYSSQYTGGATPTTLKNSSGNDFMINAPGYTGAGAPSRASWSVTHKVNVQACSTPYQSGFASIEANCNLSQGRRLCSSPVTYQIDYRNVDRAPELTSATSGTFSETENWEVSATASDVDNDPVSVKVKSVSDTSPRVNIRSLGGMEPFFQFGTDSGQRRQDTATRTSGNQTATVTYEICYTQSSTDPSSPGTPCYTQSTNSTLDIYDVDALPTINVTTPVVSIDENSGGSISFSVSDADGYDSSKLKAQVASSSLPDSPSGITNSSIWWDVIPYERVGHPAPAGGVVYTVNLRVCYSDGGHQCSSSQGVSVTIKDVDRPPTIVGRLVELGRNQYVGAFPPGHPTESIDLDFTPAAVSDPDGDPVTVTLLYYYLGDVHETNLGTTYFDYESPFDGQLMRSWAYTVSSADYTNIGVPRHACNDEFWVGGCVTAPWNHIDHRVGWIYDPIWDAGVSYENSQMIMHGWTTGASEVDCGYWSDGAYLKDPMGGAIREIGVGFNARANGVSGGIAEVVYRLHRGYYECPQ